LGISIISLVVSILSAGIAFWIGQKNIKLEKQNQKLEILLSSPKPLLQPGIVSSGKGSEQLTPLIRISNLGPGHAYDTKVYLGLKRDDKKYVKLTGTNFIPGPDFNYDKYEKLDALPNIKHYECPIEEDLDSNISKVKITYKSISNIEFVQIWEKISVSYPDNIFSKQDEFKLKDHSVNIDIGS